MSSFGRRLATLLAVSASTCVLAAACGGNTSDDDDTTGGQPSTGGRAATGGLPVTGGQPASGGKSTGGGGSATGGRASAGGTPATGGTGEAGAGGNAAGEGGSGNLDPVCHLPADPGPCDAAIASYYFDADAGGCRQFIYGGCQGNGNRFATLADCLSACGQGTPCESSSECVAIRTPACCAACEPVEANNFLAVHRDDAPKYQSPDCDVVCGPCPDPSDLVPTSGNFFAECVETKCVLRDVRDAAASECERDEDCQLRSGTGCCDDCGDRPVAISNEQALLGLLQCPELACPPCVSVFPDHEAICADGNCRVVLR